MSKETTPYNRAEAAFQKIEAMPSEEQKINTAVKFIFTLAKEKDWKSAFQTADYFFEMLTESGFLLEKLNLCGNNPEAINHVVSKKPTDDEIDLGFDNKGKFGFKLWCYCEKIEGLKEKTDKYYYKMKEGFDLNNLENLQNLGDIMDYSE